VKKAHDQLSLNTDARVDVESSCLPVIDILDVDPHIPKAVSGGSPNQPDIITTFFRLLHGQLWSQSSTSVPYLTCVAVVADRFDAIAAFRTAVRNTSWIELFRKSFNKLPEANEELVRQKLLLAIYLREYRLMSSLTAKLITQGSCRWDDLNDGKTEGDFRGLWWDLPCGIEG
jgi:hypothetical protein